MNTSFPRKRESSLIPACAGMTLSVVLCLLSFVVSAAEPYFITLEKLELKKVSGEWVNVIEPDHKVDLRSTEPSISFFNNGRVPEAPFNNFKITFDDHGKTRQISRRADLEKPVVIKKGSFINAAFVLDLENNAQVKDLTLTVDEDTRIDSGETITDTRETER